MRAHTKEVLQAKMDALQAEYDEVTEQVTWLQNNLQVAKDKRTALKAERDAILAEVAADPVP